MQATLTGLKYVIKIQDAVFQPTDVRIAIHEFDRKTYKIKPDPLITIHTNIDGFAQSLHTHFTKPPFECRKGEPVE